MDCRLDEKHQKNTCDIGVVYIRGSYDPSLGNGFHVVSYRQLNDNLKYVSLTFQQAETLKNANMVMRGQRAAGGARFKLRRVMIRVWVELRAIKNKIKIKL